MDDVKRLLEEFADSAVDGIPPADVDADVARGRRALRRIKARRRVTGVLIAAATTAVLAIGNQVWRGGGETEVATDPAEAAGGSQTPTPTMSPSASAGDETLTLFSGAAIELVANQQTWSGIGCTLAPAGWTPETPVAVDRVVLTPPNVRTSNVGAKLVLQASAEAQSLASVRAIQGDGKVFHVGTAGGREVGQVKLDQRWLVVQLPTGTKEWTDDVLQRFMASCSFR